MVDTIDEAHSYEDSNFFAIEYSKNNDFVINWHNEYPIRDRFEARRFLRSVFNNRKGNQFEDLIDNAFSKINSKTDRVILAEWFANVLNSWMAVFRATGVDDYDVLYSTYYDFRSDFERRLDAVTERDKKLFVNLKPKLDVEKERILDRTKFPRYKDFEILEKIINQYRLEEKDFKIDFKNKRNQALMKALLGLFFPITKDNFERWDRLEVGMCHEDAVNQCILIYNGLMNSEDEHLSLTATRKVIKEIKKIFPESPEIALKNLSNLTK